MRGMERPTSCRVVVVGRFKVYRVVFFVRHPPRTAPHRLPGALQGRRVYRPVRTTKLAQDVP